ncbi:hypothetical protein [Saccharothrix deserti]|nr:hypothetical protein [Saccharothrix deserti]
MTIPATTTPGADTPDIPPIQRRILRCTTWSSVSSAGQLPR